jgi:hypothetical protein
MIKWIVIALLGLIILGYLGFDVRRAVEAPVTQSNLAYAKNVTIYVWNKYLERPAKYLWNEIFVKLIWTPSINALTKKISQGTATTTLDVELNQ